MKHTKMIRRLGAIAAVATLAAGCELDLANPNAVTEDVVLSDVNGVVALAVGMQGQFAQSVEDYLVPVSLITDEWGTRTRSLLSYQSLLTGLSFENTYDVVNTPYVATYQIAKSANTLLRATDQLDLGTGFEAGIRALAKLFKAMALGQAAQEYSVLPTDVNVAGGAPKPRTEVFDTVIALLESARNDIVTVPDSALAGFRSRVLGAGIDIRNTIDAMLARYNLYRGNYQAAIAAATRVSPVVLSVLQYPGATVNPVFGLAISLQYVGGLATFVNGAEPGDRRPSYWLQTTVAAIPGNPADTLTYTLRKYSTANEPFPIYLPDEMKLIRAEAEARLGNLANARDLINQVRTQASSSVDEPVAGLLVVNPSDLASILRQIAYERRYELYMQGTRWEDVRRLQLSVVTPFPFLPLPAQECRNNPSAKGLGGC